MLDAEWFDKRLVTIREKAGLTQQALAEKVNMARVSLARLETGVRKPTWEVVIALCNAMGVMPDEFARSGLVVDPPRQEERAPMIGGFHPAVSSGASGERPVSRHVKKVEEAKPAVVEKALCKSCREGKPRKNCRACEVAGWHAEMVAGAKPPPGRLCERCERLGVVEGCEACKGVRS